MNLDISKWQEFRVDALFPVLKNGKANQGMLEEGSDCFYVGAKKNDNGVMIHCAKDKSIISKGNCIVFICNGQGSVGFANYMDVDFIGTTDIVAGYNKNLNKYNGVFIATVFCRERPKYSFGRKWKTHLKSTVAKLPTKYNADGTPYIDETHKYSEFGYVPDWKFMEEYIKSLRHKPLTTSNKMQNKQPIDITNYHEFTFGKLVSKVYKAKAINKDDLDEAESMEDSIRYITRTAEDNGCEMRAVLSDVDRKKIEKRNAITIGDTTATCFYQDEQFITGDHMIVIRADWLNKYTAMFILTFLKNEQFKYSYGRAYLMDRVKETIVKLPYKKSDDGSPLLDETHKYSDEGYIPDWDYMEKYIKSLPYGDRI